MTEVKKTVKKDGPDKGAVRYEHPSYGQIRIARQSGGNNVLYGSRLKHNHVISIEINRSVMDRYLYHDTHFQDGRLPLIEVHMSHVQFAEMLTNMNTQGIPCTIHSFNGDHLDAPDQIENLVEAFEEDLDDNMQEIRDLVEKAQLKTNEMMKGKTVKKCDLDEIRNLFHHLSMGVSGNLHFMRESFVKSMEDGVQRAKAEFDAHVLHVAQETGIKALKEMAPSMVGAGGAGTNAIDVETISDTKKLGESGSPEGES